MASIIAFVQLHSAAMAGLAVGLIDFLIAVNPAWESNSIVHMLLSVLKPKAPPVA